MALVNTFMCWSCSDRQVFQSRPDWLYHLLTNQHSQDAVKNIRQWPDGIRRNTFIIGGLNEKLFNRTTVLDFVIQHVKYFCNIVFFQPVADICAVVSDVREFEKFSGVLHLLGGNQLQFLALNEISSVQWDSLFHTPATASATPASTQQNYGYGSYPPSRQEVEGDEIPRKRLRVETNLERQPEISQSTYSYPYTQYGYKTDYGNPSGFMVTATASASTSSSTSYYQADKTNNDIDNFQWNGEYRKNLGTGLSKESLPPTTEPVMAFVTDASLDTDIKRICSLVTMTEYEWCVRMRIVEELTNTFRVQFPHCEIVPVGEDFLGHNIAKDTFTLYFDSNGFSVDANVGQLAVILESNKTIQDLKTLVLTLLQNERTREMLTNVASESVQSISFKHAASNIRCKLLLKPFMVAQTAKLCKQFYNMDRRARFLLRMLVYWSKEHDEFTCRGLCNPYVLHFLVYFFLMDRGILPPVNQLQKSCSFEILDEQENVAFTYNIGHSQFGRHFQSSRMEPLLSSSESDIVTARSNVQLLLDWFIYIDDTLGETNGTGINRRHSLVCPRFAKLIDKRKFKICKEAFKPKKRSLSSDQKKVRKLWSKDLINIGFEESSWSKLRGLHLPDTLCIQHPLYIAKNISLNFDGPFSKLFFVAIQKTRLRLEQLLSDTPLPLDFGLLQALSN